MININKTTHSLSLRDKTLIGIGTSSAVLGIALLVLINYNPALFSSSFSLHDYSKIFYSTAFGEISLVILIPALKKIFQKPQELQQDFCGNIQESEALSTTSSKIKESRAWESLCKIKNNITKKLQRRFNHTDIKSSEKADQERKIWIHHILNLGSAHPPLKDKRIATGNEVEATRPENDLVSWLCNIPKEERILTKQTLIAELLKLQKKLPQERPSQQLYEQVIFTSIKIHILEETKPHQETENLYFLSQILGPLSTLFCSLEVKLSDNTSQALEDSKLNLTESSSLRVQQRRIRSRAELKSSKSIQEEPEQERDSRGSFAALSNLSIRSSVSSLFGSVVLKEKKREPSPSFQTNKEHILALISAHSALKTAIRRSFETLF